MQNRSVSLRPDCELTITSVPILGADGSSEGAALRLSAKSGPILPPTRHVDASRMRGSGTQMASVRRRMNKILNSPSSVYISGETGTGKGLLARAIHYESNRRDKPFVIISCANIPETLFESELFGYEGGAFTGALKSGKQGKMELAEGGTLFLDEISEMPMSMQAKLLTVLQDRQFERVGGTRPIPLNTRIISASNADIRQRIAEGRFRADLFYRLNVIDMEMCPLRERLEDLPGTARRIFAEVQPPARRRCRGLQRRSARAVPPLQLARQRPPARKHRRILRQHGRRQHRPAR